MTTLLSIIWSRFEFLTALSLYSVQIYCYRPLPCCFWIIALPVRKPLFTSRITDFAFANDKTVSLTLLSFTPIPAWVILFFSCGFHLKYLYMYPISESVPNINVCVCSHLHNSPVCTQPPAVLCNMLSMLPALPALEIPPVEKTPATHIRTTVLKV